MKSFLESKAMAKVLRAALAERDIELSHSACLEIIARQFGVADWNTLSARIDKVTAKSLASPEGWHPTSNTDLTRYRLGMDPEEKGVARIESRFDRQSGDGLSAENFACLMQSIVAEPWLGERIRLTASLRSEGADLGTIWMRVDAEPGKVLHFDNMMDRAADGPVSGTATWKTRTVVLDVPPNAESIHYGFFLKGYGRVFARDFNIGAVKPDTPSTEVGPYMARRSRLLDAPANLGFS